MEIHAILKSKGISIDTPCKGCQCHEMAMQFGELIDGCCRECGCPKNLAGFQWYLDNKVKKND